MLRKKLEYERGDKGEMLMTTQNLRLFCLEDELYEYPDLNSKIYLHYKGFTKIANLDAYVNLISLWLENNCIRKIEGLEKLTKLRTLFLQNNLIEKIEGLEPAKGLKILNLSHNRIEKIEGLDVLPELENLDISSNLLKEKDNLEGLTQCQSLTNISLIGNQIEGGEEMIELFMRMKNIACIYLKGNPFVSAIRNYRKRFICSIPELKYLDDRPVFVEEKRLCEAWAKGGNQAELEERQKIGQEKRDWNKQYAQELIRKRNEVQDKKKRMIEEAKQQSEIQQENIKAELENIKDKEDTESKQKYQQLEQQLKQEEIQCSVKEQQIKDELHPPMPAYSQYDFSKDKDVIISGKKQEDPEEIEENKQEEKMQEIEENKQEIEQIQVPQEPQKTVLNVEELLEALLERHSFNFEIVTVELNKIIKDMNNKKGEKQQLFKEMAQKEVEEVWTKQEIMLREKFIEEQKKLKDINFEDVD